MRYPKGARPAREVRTDAAEKVLRFSTAAGELVTQINKRLDEINSRLVEGYEAAGGADSPLAIAEAVRSVDAIVARRDAVLRTHYTRGTRAMKIASQKTDRALNALVSVQTDASHSDSDKIAWLLANAIAYWQRSATLLTTTLQEFDEITNELARRALLRE